MRKRCITVFILPLFLLPSQLFCAGFEASFNFKAELGDPNFDSVLGELNVQAQADVSGFLSEVSVMYDIPQPDIDIMIKTYSMTPIDVYLTGAIAYVVHIPVEVVVQRFQTDRKKGWGVIAKALGIKPGSAEFHRLKQGGSMQLEKFKSKGHAKEGKDKDEKGTEKSKEKKSEGSKGKKK